MRKLIFALLLILLISICAGKEISVTRVAKAPKEYVGKKVEFAVAVYETKKIAVAKARKILKVRNVLILDEIHFPPEYKWRSGNPVKEVR